MVILLVALSLSMDAFSLAIIYGMFGLNKKEEITLSFIVGLYHFIMPLIGSLFGNIIFNYVPIKFNYVVSIIFIIIGVQMLIDSYKHEDSHMLNGIIEMLLFGLAVSIDSFGTGIGLKYLSSNMILSAFTFSIVSLLFTYIGLNFGKKIGVKIGKISNILGATILIILGFIYIFK
ncbi:MAG: manganese efflux pump [Bacilli bacterium]|nr:manganese efflux pump [Bacilli bacterium]